MESLFFEKHVCFSIRKLSVGACSVVIGISALGLSKGPCGRKASPRK